MKKQTAKAEERVKDVGIWVRVSTDDQARGESPEIHEKRARMYAEVRGYRVRELYRLDAVSGKAVIGHPEAVRMLADIRSGHITGLVFSKIARLARNTKELLEFADVFRDAHADMISLQEAIDTGSPAGRLFFTIIAAMAQWEREEIASRVAAAVPVRAKLGMPLGGAAPFGYQWVNKKLVVDEKEAPIRALMYELFLEHKRKKAVARILNERGYRTRGGSRFTDTTVDRLLRDATAKGTHRQNYTYTDDKSGAWSLKGKEEWALNPVEPIIKEELWGQVNALLDDRRASHKKPSREEVHLFSGYAHCTCGALMYPEGKTLKYLCRQCRNKIPVGDLEAIYREELTRFLVNPADVQAHREAADEAMQAKERLVTTVEAELRKIVDEDERLYQLYLSEQIAAEAFGERHKPMMARKAELEAELPKLQAELDVMRIASVSSQAAAADAKDLSTHWETFSRTDKRQLIETITDKITIGKDEVVIDLLYLPSAGTSGSKATQPQGFIAATSWTRLG